MELTSVHVVRPNKIFNKYNENMYKTCIQLVFMHIVRPNKIFNKYNENMYKMCIQLVFKLKWSEVNKNWNYQWYDRIISKAVCSIVLSGIPIVCWKQICFNVNSVVSITTAGSGVPPCWWSNDGFDESGHAVSASICLLLHANHQ